jgi:molecular chaperone GrpE
MDPAWEALVERFRAHLERAAEGESSPAAQTPAPPDLFSLLAELAALTSEVKLESRQVKSALEQFRDLFDSLQRANQQLSAELARQRQDAREIAENAERDLLLELVDLRDRLRDGRARAVGYKPNWLGHASGAGEFITLMAQGLGMNLRRLDETLERREVYPIETLGRPFDPRIMTAIEVARDPTRPTGTVLVEVRVGYRRGESLLRLAEVIVNKHEERIQ